MSAREALLDRPVESLSRVEQLVVSGMWDNVRKQLSPTARRRFLYRWQEWRRPNQVRPSGMGTHHKVWNIKAGRGYGKTRVGAEESREMSERVARIAIVGATAADARDVMIEGESGILAAFPRGEMPNYEPSKRRIEFRSGCRAQVYSAEEPERLRGPQHGWAWVDEPASMPDGKDAIDNLLLGLRLGRHPWLLMTGTPKPLAWLKAISERPDCIITRGSTYDNIANLAESFVNDVLGRYEGTRLGRQELHAEDIDDVEGALWSMASIDDGRIAWDTSNPWGSLNAWLATRGLPLYLRDRAWRTIIAVDPPGETAECGIVTMTAPTRAVAGRDHAVVLRDDSLAGPPEKWGAQVVAVFKATGAQAVYVESNQGGDMVRSTIHAVDPSVPVKKIRAKDSKYSRAEPVSALYESPRRWIHHTGFLPMLESQMVTWVPTEGKSPDRIDALAHAARELLAFTEVPKSTIGTPNKSGRRMPTYG